jgi:serine/threonine protein kinase
VVQTFGISVDGALPCIVLEFCGGGSLDTKLFDNEAHITLDEKVKLIKGMARGLLHLHQNNVVHRDLAARNILLTKSGEPKISDFGMSRLLKEASQKGQTKNNIGPIRWMAPESLRDLTYSTKSDVWSFGILMYEVLTGSEPHTDIDGFEVAIKIKNESYHPAVPSTVDPALGKIMLSCWNADPAARPSMEQVLAEIFTHFSDEDSD